MFDLKILEVAIGLVLLYALLALVVTAVTEAIARLLALRAQLLQKALRELLGDRALADAIYGHGLLRGLPRERLMVFWRHRPSHIPGRYFALALLDLVRRRAGPATVEPRLADAIRVLGAEGEEVPEPARGQVAEWFETAMQSLTQRYKRNAAFIAFLVALVLALIINGDTIMMAQRLWRDDTMRTAVAMTVEERLTAPQGVSGDVDATLSELERLMEAHASLPIGWPGAEASGSLTSARYWPRWGALGAQKVIGLLITAVAAALGAPFWFDLLGRLSALRRSTGGGRRSSGRAEAPRD